VVLADSHGITRAPCYSGNAQERQQVFVYRTLTVYGRPSHTVRLTRCFITPRPAGRPGKNAPTTPHTQPLPGITRPRFSLIRFRSPLLTESHLFSLPAGTEMFHFPAFPPTALYIQTAATPHNECQVPPFGNPRITVWLPTPRGISQAPTSFIGSRCQGIHRAPSTT
jgi:hypothetical protein